MHAVEHTDADVARAVTTIGAQQGGGERPRRFAFAAAGRPREQVGVHGCRGGSRETAGRLFLPDEPF
jgi:hypothetical protein